ncbi:sensor protein KdpD [Rugosibacter aromaticivorans]|uniref:histidine kinase n=1 Tax=Rugosibacter aromaticivorans TaxID=1565605 RepID=A0A0C5J7E6_9PROT|nr:two-component system sensor histidine kinase KdpD [Rugosibacter aromaticivorans]AJP47608.1 sensor protein KdpD [Rugosibacter aromaticivorans]
MAQDDQRPNPDELLERVQFDEQQERHGKLKIFFGASPGVGKTYAMLNEARRLRTQGLDVVVGVVETHGRSETAVLLEGQEILPRKDIAHRNGTRKEFDLDAALKRRPAVLLVDELAHSNAPGCRHPKRWQDVEELLAAGIDVLTTVNVQHIESLNDIVGSITGIRVWETVPDHVFAGANEIVLVDLPPEDLLVRLREGKVYLPEQAERAIQNFFRKGNLIALRELALRQTADRVDDQMRALRRTSAQWVWQTRDTLLACIGPGDVDEKVVRTAARLAAKLDATWHAVYVETPNLQRLPEARRRAVLKTLKLAQELGAETATLSGQDAVASVLDYARCNNLGRIVVGRSTGKRWQLPGRAPFSQRLGAHAPDIDLIAVARDALGTRRPSTVSSGLDEAARVKPQLRGYLYAALTCIGITVVATPLQQYFEPANIAMLFLLGVVFIANQFGRGPAALAALLNVAAFDFFFVPPHLSFAVSDVQYVVTFAVMLIVGLVIGHLTAGLRYQLWVARSREQRARSLAQMAKSLSSALVEEQVVALSDKFVESTFHAKAAILLPDLGDRLQMPTIHGSTPTYDLVVAQWSYDKNEPAGAGTDTLPANAQLYLPLKAPMRVRGVLVVEPDNLRLLMIPEQRRLLDTFAALVAIALERIHFVSVAKDTLIRMESERLRNSLLTTLSHDLRTPLTTLVGLAETLLLDLVAAESTHADKASAIHEQALHTSRLVNDLLEMAKLQSGEITLRKDWQSLEEIVGSALKSLEPLMSKHPLELDLPAGLPLVRCDAVLLERVLVNLLENATKYTSPETLIGIRVSTADTVVRVEVWDQGAGLPPGQERAIFDKFARGQKESAIPGTGLGLAICEAIVQAHGGKIWAENHAPQGARFVFTLPLEAQPSIEPEVPDESGTR